MSNSSSSTSERGGKGSRGGGDGDGGVGGRGGNGCDGEGATCRRGGMRSGGNGRRRLCESFDLLNVLGTPAAGTWNDSGWPVT